MTEGVFSPSYPLMDRGSSPHAGAMVTIDPIHALWLCDWFIGEKNENRNVLDSRSPTATGQKQFSPVREYASNRYVFLAPPDNNVVMKTDESETEQALPKMETFLPQRILRLGAAGRPMPAPAHPWLK